MELDLELMALNKLRKLAIGQRLRVSDAAKNDPELFIYLVKRLIHCGWIEYEFNHDYTEIKRLDMPEFGIQIFENPKPR